MIFSDLEQRTERYDFYQAVFLVERQLKTPKSQYRQVGYDAIPTDELIRFRSVQHLGFPGNPLTNVAIKSGKGSYHCATFDISFFGLTGPNAALPQHYSELMLERIRLKDTAMRDFFDLFNHRLISLYYRAWKKYRQAIGYNMRGLDYDDPHTVALSHLARGKTDTHLHMAGLLQRPVPSAQGLIQLLRYYLECDVEVEQFVGKWLSLDPSEQTRLAGRMLPEGQHARLGVDASIGKSFWDINTAIAIVISCDDENKARTLLPSGKFHTTLQSLLDIYLGHLVSRKIKLITKTKYLPVAALGNSSSRLGQGGILETRKQNRDKSYTVYLRS
ncbi:type VI secretion system baseplate subunit TssG [Algicola sagamiensis]|uniref:type VI secretion system baseplate subunit TssG n=1 Tax=Algicola sagamiensis TaxID=163869 RepID=UPI000369BE71|nr:type VI secretion system baseplate subunit TssG [Algicola sagamiensis]